MKIEHIGLYVRDLPRAKEFFCRYFGCLAGEDYHNLRTDFQSCFLRFEDGARLELMTKPGLSDGDDSMSRFGYAHLAIRVGSPEVVDCLTDRLKEDGYAVISGPRRTGDGYYESVVLDAEGNQIEITV